MKVTVLASGSQGNCAVIESGRELVLVDAGISARQIEARLRSIGASPYMLKGILISHEHADHWLGLKSLLRKYEAIPIYFNQKTGLAIGQECGAKEWRLFQTGKEFSIGNLDVNPFGVPHDAVDPVAFSFHHNSRIVAIVTDLGMVSKGVERAVQDASLIVLEANYEPVLLNCRTDCPPKTKRRIDSLHGHLSNHQAAELIAKLAGARLERAVLAHLSVRSNNPEMAMVVVWRAVLEKLGDKALGSLQLSCATQRFPTETFSV